MKLKLLTFLVATACSAAAQAALTAGDIAIIGRTNDATPDKFTFVTLVDVAAGETIYFTDNGWTGSGYRGSSATDGDGNENMAAWVTSSFVGAGTIISSAALTVTGKITGTTTNYGELALSQTGDQIYAFQNSNASNPLFNTSTQTALFVLDDTNGFESGTSSSTGAVPTGLSVAANTAVTLNPTTLAGTARVKASVLATVGNNKAAWLAAIANPNNWESGATTAVALPTGAISVSTVPEPAGYAMALAGLAAIGVAARCRKL
jgi:hypothetical protein